MPQVTEIPEIIKLRILPTNSKRNGQGKWEEIVTSVLPTEDYCLENTKESVHKTLKEESDYSTSGLERGSVVKGILLLFIGPKFGPQLILHNTPSGGS